MVKLLIATYTLLMVCASHISNYISSIGKLDNNMKAIIGSILVFIIYKIGDSGIIYYGSICSTKTMLDDKSFPSLTNDDINKYQTKVQAIYAIHQFENLSICFYIISIIAYLIIGWKFPVVWIGLIFQSIIGIITYVVGQKIENKAAISELIYRTYTKTDTSILKQHFGIDSINMTFEQECIQAFIANKKISATLVLFNNLTQNIMIIFVEIFLCLLYVYFNNSISTAYFASGCIIGIGTIINNASRNYRLYCANKKIMQQ